MKPMSTEAQNALLTEYFPGDGRDALFASEEDRHAYLLEMVENISRLDGIPRDQVVENLLQEAKRSLRRSVVA